MQNYNIMLVDDDPNILAGFGLELENEGHRVTRASSGEEALTLLNNNSFDLVVTDLIMGETDGLMILKKSKELNPDIAVIILTGYGDVHSAIEALRLNADDYLLKPCETEELYFRVNRCLEKLEMKRQIMVYEELLPVCCVCKKIRDDSGTKTGNGMWLRMEEYIHEKSGKEITHTYCPECAEKVKEQLE